MTTESWISQLRSHCKVKFHDGGAYESLKKHEDWRYTSLKNKKLQDFKSQKPIIAFANILDMLARSYPLKAKEVLNFLTKNTLLPEDLILSSGEELYANYITDEITDDSKLLRNYLNVTCDQGASKPLVLENTSLFENGILIHIQEGAHIQLPIYSFVTNSINQKEESSSFIRNIIILEANSSATWIEDYISEAKVPYCNQIVNEIILKENANLNHLKWQRESAEGIHFCTNQVLQYQNSHYSSNVFTTGASLSRNEIHIKMMDESCHSRLSGIHTGRDNQHSDHHIKIEHTKPHCVSSQTYRGSLKDKATSVFRGNIHVHPGAQKTVAHQSSKTLLLSQEAEMYAKPQLEIFADDVICSHGTTMGQLEEESLFYLKSRGISHEEASILLEEGFLTEAMDDYPDVIFKKYILDVMKEIA